MRIIKITLLFLLIASVAFASCNSKGALQAEKPPLKIAISTWPGYAHAFIAQDKGFELVFTKEYADAAELYKKGQVDGIFEVFADAVFHNSESIPTKVVYVADHSDSGDVIVARPAINSLLELKGRPVGIDGLNTFSHLFVLSILKKAGVKEEDMRFEIVSALEVPKALDEGRIFAGHTWEPAKSEALKKGYKVIAKAGDIPGIITDVLSVREDVTKARPDDIRAIVKALFKAQDFVRSNRAEAVKIMAKAEGMTVEEMDAGLKGTTIPGLAQNKKEMERSDEPVSLFNLGKLIYDFYGKRGRVFVEADLNSIIDPQFLEKK